MDKTLASFRRTPLKTAQLFFRWRDVDDRSDNTREVWQNDCKHLNFIDSRIHAPEKKTHKQTHKQIQNPEAFWNYLFVNIDVVFVARSPTRNINTANLASVQVPGWNTPRNRCSGTMVKRGHFFVRAGVIKLPIWRGKSKNTNGNFERFTLLLITMYCLGWWYIDSSCREMWTES